MADKLAMLQFLAYIMHYCSVEHIFHVHQIFANFTSMIISRN